MGGAEKFEWYQLRSTDVAAAGEFYAAVLGLEPRVSASGLTLYEANEPVAEISQLPERARLLGAPSHWLGHIGVADVEHAARYLIERGAERRPAPPTSDGTALAILRDPFGAIVALRSPPRAPARRLVALHQSFARDVEVAWSLYSELFGWRPVATPVFPASASSGQAFTWEADGEAVGIMLSNAGAPHIHDQWLYYFSVPNIDRALESALARGRHPVDSPVSLPNGARIAVCDDVCGASFGLFERG